MQRLSNFVLMTLFGISLMMTMASTSNNFSQVKAQSTEQLQQSLFNTVIINLQGGRENTLEGTMVYEEIESIETTIPELQGIEAGSSDSTNISVSGDLIDVSFPAQIPADPQSPNGLNVLEIDIELGVNTIESKPDGLNLYYGEPGLASSTILDYVIIEGVLEEMSEDEAVITVTLKEF